MVYPLVCDVSIAVYSLRSYLRCTWRYKNASKHILIGQLAKFFVPIHQSSIRGIYSVNRISVARIFPQTREDSYLARREVIAVHRQPSHLVSSGRPIATAEPRGTAFPRNFSPDAAEDEMSRISSLFRFTSTRSYELRTRTSLRATNARQRAGNEPPNVIHRAPSVGNSRNARRSIETWRRPWSRYY